MNKSQADTIILQYQKKIYGFALSKLSDLAEAEELASEIICQVYQAFRQQDNIANPDGYVYRIARNIYAQTIRRKKQTTYAELWEGAAIYEDTSYSRLEQDETMQTLRRGIGLLSKQQRTIIYLHYYENKSIGEIAQHMTLPIGTVKWHLSEARTHLNNTLTRKEGSFMSHKNKQLAVNPIYFISMGHNGNPGSTGNTKDYFTSRLRQNIAWCCYHTQHTAEEIARLLETPLFYIESEVEALVDYGYLDIMNSAKHPKYRTNMVIEDYRKRDSQEKDQFFQETAKILCNELYPAVLDSFEKEPEHWGFHAAGQNINYMKYNLVMLITNYLCFQPTYNWSEQFEKYAVRRPDGGHFVAHAIVSDDCHSKQIPDPYWVYGYMTQELRQDKETFIASTQLNCRFCSRNADYRDNPSADWKNLFQWIQNPETLAPEAYKQLCDKGYIRDNQMVLMYLPFPNKSKSENSFSSLCQQVIHNHVTLSDRLKDFGKEVDNTWYELQKPLYPEHILPIIRWYSTSSLNRSAIIPYVIEEMLGRGMLEPLSEEERKTVFTVIGF